MMSGAKKGAALVACCTCSCTALAYALCGNSDRTFHNSFGVFVSGKATRNAPSLVTLARALSARGSLLRLRLSPVGHPHRQRRHSIPSKPRLSSACLPHLLLHERGEPLSCRKRPLWLAAGNNGRALVSSTPAEGPDEPARRTRRWKGYFAPTQEQRWSGASGARKRSSKLPTFAARTKKT